MRVNGFLIPKHLRYLSLRRLKLLIELFKPRL